ncbi:MAG: nitroreductase family protein [Armatimonadetes bacterium]|nr:nitroreductase family protein [Armatimonadota bacterium]
MKFAEAWRERFGTAPPTTPEDLTPLLGHRSIRDYANTEVSEELVGTLIGVAQSAATSSNLQLWSVVSIQEPTHRQELARLCANQRQVANAPWFLAFIVDHHRLVQAAAKVGEEALGLDFNEFYTMAVIDAALAAERLVCAAEFLGLGVCYIGALRNDPEGVRLALDLPERTFGVFGLCLGWPSEDNAAMIKPRLPSESVWFRERYDPKRGIGDSDARMTEFYEKEKMKGEVTWSMRSGRRVDEHHLTGREVLKEFLSGQRFDRR